MVMYVWYICRWSVGYYWEKDLYSISMTVRKHGRILYPSRHSFLSLSDIARIVRHRKGKGKAGYAFNKWSLFPLLIPSSAGERLLIATVFYRNSLTPIHLLGALNADTKSVPAAVPSFLVVAFDLLLIISLYDTRLAVSIGTVALW